MIVYPTGGGVGLIGIGKALAELVELGDFLVLDAVRQSGGTAVAVTDEALLAELRAAAAAEGSWLCPEGAAGLAAVRDLRAGGWLGERDEVVVLNTGAGLKYPETVPADPPLLPRDGVLP